VLLGFDIIDCIEYSSPDSLTLTPVSVVVFRSSTFRVSLTKSTCLADLNNALSFKKHKLQ